jgi:hypothetical protein
MAMAQQGRVGRFSGRTIFAGSLGLSIALAGISAPAIAAPPPNAAISAIVAAAGGDPVIAVAGDIACDPADSKFNGGSGVSNGCRQGATADLMVGAGLSGVLALGDNQYYCGSYAAFQGSYDRSWGRLKSITYPSVGNHEYLTHGGSSASTGCDATNTGAAGYYQYFGAAAGDPAKGYYSADIGSWHLIALNTQCSSAGGCSSTSPQGKWLAADLAAHQNMCTLAFFHIPLFSSGGRSSANAQSFWQMLYDHQADVIVNGHDHIYERFAPQNPGGAVDSTNGIREFIVGTGGANLTSLAATAPNSQVRDSNTFGVMALTLHADRYEWKFVPEVGKTFTDSGSAQCHRSGGGGGGGGGGGADTSAPSVPAITSASAPSSGRVDLAWSASTDDTAVTGYTVYRDGSPIQTLGAGSTSTSDVTVSPSTSYSYTVDAFDAAGNHSAKSAAAVVVTPASSPTTTLVPVADAYTDASKPTSNYGSSTALRFDGSPVVRSYLSFDLSGVSAPITKATLRVYANSSAAAGFDAAGVSTSWSESTLTAGNAPTPGSSVGVSGPFTAGSWASVDVTSLLGSNTLGVALSGINTTATSLASRESGANAPQLVLEH